MLEDTNSLDSAQLWYIFCQFSIKYMLWVLIRIANKATVVQAILMYPQRMFLRRNKQNYPLIIIRNPHHLFH